MTTQAEFIQQQADSGEWTANQGAALLDMALEGDTDTTSESGSQPEAATDEATLPEGTEQGEQAEDAIDPANAVILAKDGKHTIEYQKLVDAREGEKEWKAKALEAQTEIDALRAQAQERADAGQAPTTADQQLAIAEQAIDAGFDPGIFGDFTEEDLAKGISAIVDQRVAAHVERQVEARLKPLQVKDQVSAHEAHIAAVHAVHPDADSIMESKELDAWINAQPSFARAGYQSALNEGSAGEVIELFDAFKSATGSTQAAQGSQQDGVRAAAKAAIGKAATPAPASLSDIPGSVSGPASRSEALADMSPTDMTEAMAGMSPSQIEDFLSRRI